MVPRIDTVFNSLTEKHGGKEQPEYRLPLANVGSVLLPVTLLIFAWTVEKQVHWTVPIIATVFFGFGQVSIFNTSQNYYIDAFSKYAASAIAAGTVLRSVAGGVVPLFVPALFDKLGYGWGWSLFAFLTLLLSPAPLVFYEYGRGIREKYEIDL